MTHGQIVRGVPENLFDNDLNTIFAITRTPSPGYEAYFDFDFKEEIILSGMKIEVDPTGYDGWSAATTYNLYTSVNGVDFSQWFSTTQRWREPPVTKIIDFT